MDVRAYYLSREDFDGSRRGVRGLVESGIKGISHIFRNPNPIEINCDGIRHESTVPIIDLKDSPYNVVNKIRQASSSLGIFQVVNHNIPGSLIDGVIQATKKFHDDSSEKSWWYLRDKSSDYDRGTYYYSNVDLFHSEFASWHDVLHVRLNPLSTRIPFVCENEVTPWNTVIRHVAERVMGYLFEGLGIAENHLAEDRYIDRASFLGYYYPFCPDKLKTYGERSHSDPGIITVIVPEERTPLQVKDGQNWGFINNFQLDALLIKVGDLLQIISNDRYMSGEHRVLANPFKIPKASVSIIYSPGFAENVYGPLPHLVPAYQQPLCRSFSFAHYTNTFFTKELVGKPMVNYYKI
ncbi:hypothetical protein vseg_001532 [Gypsophila vaccaria]